MTTQQKIEHNRQVEQARAEHHKRRCEEDENYKRVYEAIQRHNTLQTQTAQLVNAAIQNQTAKIANGEIVTNKPSQEGFLQSQLSAGEMLWMLFMKIVFPDEKTKQEFVSFQTVAAEIANTDAEYDRQLERFDKYEL